MAFSVFGFHPRKRLLRRWHSTWGRFPSRLHRLAVLAVLADLDVHRFLVGRVGLVVLLVLVLLAGRGHLAVLVLLAVLGLLHHRVVLVVLVLLARSELVLLVGQGRLVVLGLLGCLLGLEVLVVRESGFLRSCLVGLGLLGFLLVLVGLVVLADRLGMACMELEQQRHRRSGHSFLVLLAVLDHLDYRDCRVDLGDQLDQVLRHCNRRSNLLLLHRRHLLHLHELQSRHLCRSRPDAQYDCLP